MKKVARILGVILVLIGIALFGISMYINSEVAAGRVRASDAQSQVDQGNSLFSMHPYTKEAGKMFTGPAQEEINAGNLKISHYARRANWYQIGGIVLVILGIGVIFVGGRKFRK